MDGSRSVKLRPLPQSIRSEIRSIPTDFPNIPRDLRMILTKIRMFGWLFRNIPHQIRMLRSSQRIILRS